MPMTNDSIHPLAALMQRYQARYGERDAAMIMEMLFTELGGLRVTIPTMQQILLYNRNDRIRKQFTGANHEELALMYGMSERQVRRIVNEQD